MEIIFLIGRILFGFLFIQNGWSHFTQNTQLSLYAQARGVPVPRVAVLATGAMIILGGLGVILGIYTKLSLLLLSIFLALTLVKIHVFWKETDQSARAMEKIQFFKNAALLGAALMFYSLLLPWPLSL